MKRGLLLTVVSVLAICLASADSPAPQIVVPAKVVSVTDGDTAAVEVTIRLNVRLIDCWAPELDEKGGKESKDGLQTLILGKVGMLTVPLDQPLTLSHYLNLSRVLGRINVDGKDAAETQCANGLATKKKPKP